MNTCPDCKCEFVQPFKCITCGAEKLYDHTVRSQQARIRELEALLDDCYESGRAPTSDELDALKVSRATLDREGEHG